MDWSQVGGRGGFAWGEGRGLCTVVLIVCPDPENERLGNKRAKLACIVAMTDIRLARCYESGSLST